MVDTTIEREITEYLGQMPVDHQRRVLEFAQALANPRIRGVPGKALRRFTCTIDKSDLEIITQAIEQDCERIDPDDW